MKKIYIMMALLSMLSIVVASCPFSGYVPGMKGVVISKWEEINSNSCFGICPVKLIEETNSWSDINESATWVYKDNQWVKRFWKCEPITKKGSLVENCRLYEQIQFQGMGNQTAFLPTQLDTQAKTILSVSDSLSFDLKELAVTLSYLILGV